MLALPTRSTVPSRDYLSTQIASLFASSEQGAGCDYSDMSTLFQDAAGTVPVTAVEQPVGRMLDKSGRGNHATQATTTKRPIYSRRVNRLIKSDQFSSAPWVRQFADIASTTDASQGDVTVFTSQGGRAALWFSVVVTDAGKAILLSVRIKAGTNRYAVVARGVSLVGSAFDQDRAFGLNFVIDLQTGSFMGTPDPNTNIKSVGDGWFDVEVFTAAASSYSQYSSGMSIGLVTSTGANSTPTGASILLKQASVALSIDAHLPYQWVNTATDYDADPAKFPAYRKEDGVDDSLASSTGGGGTTGFFFSAAISPQGSAGTARTLFSDAGTNTGYIVRLNASNQLELAAGNGTAYTTIATAGTLAVGTTDVVQAWDDGVNLNVKIGSGPTASIARPVVSAGTAGYTLYQDNGASTGYFNGRSYGEIYRKDSGLTQSQREAVALYQRQKARLP